eukprot:613518-Prorocentrum_minimum.AAC.2
MVRTAEKCPFSASMIIDCSRSRESQHCSCTTQEKSDSALGKYRMGERIQSCVSVPHNSSICKRAITGTCWRADLPQEAACAESASTQTRPGVRSLHDEGTTTALAHSSIPRHRWPQSETAPVRLCGTIEEGRGKIADPEARSPVGPACASRRPTTVLVPAYNPTGPPVTKVIRTREG